MKEDFLQYVWKHNLLHLNLFTTENEAVSIIHPGWYNSDSGPDFFNARIRIGETEWAGNIEIHVRSSDWILHCHDHDDAYDNVILHVVLHHDREILTKQGVKIPVLEMNRNFDQSLYQHYLRLLVNKNQIACEKMIGDVEVSRLQNWLDRMIIERYERKEKLLIESMHHNGNNIEELFYRKMAESFGMKVNADAFALLAKKTPMKLLSRHANSNMETEALLFGQAGFLEETFSEQYPVLLKSAYHYFRQVYQLTEMDKHVWKFLRMRPVNFPTIRISQFASLLCKSDRIFSDILATDDLPGLKRIFELDSSFYWQDHYLFGRLSTPKDKRLGKDGSSSLLLNAVIPFKFFNARRFHADDTAENVLSMLHDIDYEENSITKYWAGLGVPTKSAWDSQGLIELKHHYCDQKKCLNCHIGQHLLQRNASVMTG